jgi:hypothetical protein
MPTSSVCLRLLLAAVVCVCVRLDVLGDPAADLGCNRLAVDDRRSHQLAFFSGA